MNTRITVQDELRFAVSAVNYVRGARINLKVGNCNE